MGKTSRLGLLAFSGIACAAVLSLAACGSSSPSASSTASSTSSAAGSASPDASLTALQAQVAQLETPPTKILSASLGAFTPKPHATIAIISCEESNSSCAGFVKQSKAAAAVLGYQTTVCDAGTSPQAPGQCFTDAINEKPNAIITIAVGTNQAGQGYAAARQAHIPVIGEYTGNPDNGSVTATEVAATACAEQGQIQAEAVTAARDGKANVLLVEDKTTACDLLRGAAFASEYHKVCAGCAFTQINFELATVSQSLPSQIQGALASHPDLNYVAVPFDDPAGAIAIQEITEAGRAGTVGVASMDGSAPAFQALRQKDVESVDVLTAQGAAAWAGMDAAARIIAGQHVPLNIPVNILLVEQNNVSVLGSSQAWLGPAGFQQQFEQLWGKA
jgi:ABC-type sugar transport system substrate-binding protein